MTNDPAKEARDIANLAKLRSLVEHDRKQGGRRLLLLREALKSRLHDLEMEMIGDYYTESPEEIQKSLNKLDKCQKALDLVDKDLEGISGTERSREPDCNCLICVVRRQIDK